MVRVMTARKVPGAGPWLSCAYRRRPAPVPDSTDSDTDSDSDAGEQTRTVVTNVADMFASRGIIYTHEVSGANLSANTLAAINNIKPSVKKDWSELPEDMCNVMSGKNLKYELCQLGPTGALAPFLKRAVEEDEVVMVYSGELYTKDQWEAKKRDNTDKNHLWCYDIPAQRFKNKGYRGEDLVVAADRRGNESRYMHDPAWHKRSWPASTNLYNEVVWASKSAHTGQVLPYILFKASHDMEPGTELVAPWGNPCWMALSCHEVMAQADVSWNHHYKLDGLQAYYDKTKACGLGNDVELDEEEEEDKAEADAGSWRPSSPAGTGTGAGPSNAAGQGAGPSSAPAPAGATDIVVVFDRAVGAIGRYQTAGGGGAPPAAPQAGPSASARGTFARGQLPPPSQIFRQLTLEQVAAIFPGYREGCTFDGLPADLLHRMSEELPAGQERKVSGVATVAEEQLIASGELRGCVVAEVRARHHSVRWVTPPDCRAYTVLADRNFKKGTPVGIYGGAVTTAKQMDLVNKPEQEVYSFAISRAELGKVRPQVQWPRKGLVVDALHNGNMARFINDVWGQADDRKTNLNARVVWSATQRRPFVMLTAATDIKKGAELTLNYGEEYWVFFARYMQSVQFRFYDNAVRKISALQRWVRRVEGPERLEQVMADIEELAKANSMRLCI